MFFSFRVKNKNAAALPNVGFQAQLCLYKTLGWKIDKNNMQFKMFRLKIAARKVKKGLKILIVSTFLTIPTCFRGVFKSFL